jgi:hypothetical protein
MFCYTNIKAISQISRPDPGLTVRLSRLSRSPTVSLITQLILEEHPLETEYCICAWTEYISDKTSLDTRHPTDALRI